MKQVSLREKKMALNNAVASVEMEGYKISDNEKELCMKVLDGKLTKDEFIKIMFDKVQNNYFIMLYAYVIFMLRDIFREYIKED